MVRYKLEIYIDLDYSNFCCLKIAVIYFYIFARSLIKNITNLKDWSHIIFIT